MNQGTMTISFYDPTTDAEVEMRFTLMNPREALAARELWIQRFVMLHLSVPTFDYDGPDYAGEWEHGCGQSG